MDSIIGTYFCNSSADLVLMMVIRVAILAPPRWSKFLSYMTGWVTTIAWQASCAGTTFLLSSTIQALVKLSNPDYDAKVWHATLVFYALVGISVLVTTVGAPLFPKFEAVVLALHVLGFFAILITVVYLGPKNPASKVFQNFINGGGFRTDGESWLVGTVSVMFLFNGKPYMIRASAFHLIDSTQVLTALHIWISRTSQSLSSDGR